jgi:23S rRNA (uracil1939-C5)-methyltransferase
VSRGDRGARPGHRRQQRASRATAPDVAVTNLADDVAVGPDTQIVERVHETELVVSAGSFFQPSAAAAELLVSRVALSAGSALQRAAHIVDAYGGVGLFTATLAGRAPNAGWTMIESNPTAAGDAARNVGPVTGIDAEIALCDVAGWHATPADLVIADPARIGLRAGAVSALAATGAGRMVLVSCDAASLGRDSALLAQHGYRHVRSEVLGLFPRTPHVEVVSVFDRDG